VLVIKRKKSRHWHVVMGESAVGTCVTTSLKMMLPFVVAFHMQMKASRDFLFFYIYMYIF